MKRYFFTLFLTTWVITLLSQNTTQHKSNTLSYNLLKENSNYNKVFNLLAINNEKNINSLKLEISFTQNIYKNKNGVVMDFSGEEIKGSVFFRDFNFDTLLMPDVVKVSFLTENEEGFLEYKNLTFGFPEKIKIENVYDISNINLEFDISSIRLQQFIKSATTANHYYGYYTIFKNLKKGLLNTNEKNAYILSDFDILHRIVFNIEQLKIINILKLSVYDPKNFLSLFDKVKRLERRKHTLSLQYISKDLKTQADKKDYINSLIGISTKFLTKKNNYQPYIANSFEQTAFLANDFEMRDFYQTVCRHIDQNVKDKTPAKQSVFNSFLTHVEKYNRQEAYAYALLMLKNAIIWAQINNMKKTGEILPYINRTIDGLLASYSGIAESALKNRKFVMADKYLNKTKNNYQLNMATFPEANDSTFVNFQNHLLNFVEIEIKQKQYQKALDILFSFRQLNFNSKNKSRVYKIKKTAYNNLLVQKLNRLNITFQNGHINDAYNRLKEIKTFQNLNGDYLTFDDKTQQNLNKITYELLLKFMQNGQMLWNRKNYNEAIKNYCIAKNIENNFLNHKVKKLDELIYRTSIPVVLDKINNAELKIWANDINAAKEMQDNISKTIIKYNLSQVDTIKSKLDELNKKIKNRKCITIYNELQNNLTVIKNRIHDKKWQEALNRLLKTDKLLKNNKKCNPDSSGFVKLKSNYAPAFYYMKKLENIKNNLIIYGYNNVWKDYADLNIFYLQHELNKQSIPKPELYELVKTQKNTDNIKQIIDYYLSEDQIKPALNFINLLHETGTRDKETRKLLEITGKKMAYNKQFSKTFKSIAGKNDKWFNPLIKTYLQTIN